MIDQKDYEHVGILNKPRGVQGELNFSFSPGWLDNDIRPPFFFIKIDGYLVPFKIETIKIISDDKGYVHLEDIPTSEDAAKLTGLSFYLPKNQLQPPNNTIHPGSIIGFMVYNQNNEQIGTICDFLDIPNNPVIEVSAALNKVLVPINNELILNFSYENKTLTLIIADGLTSANLNE